ncbi:glycoside hydrolase [Bimuria novae-zelandiae CBS 107.79]|uniref:AA9 family lytic polysaccharide monooxygenase n=1 Tax=Bimuria novae-zelandiae CBS 107.79 TaxID=1447943 RepID=A0A6A5VAL3_9PLEO|nr:glycoside hydrolase [Bimuria novae-zelandiae CBS 107.79]
MKFTVATAVTALSGTTLAHGGVTTYIIDGKKYPGYDSTQTDTEQRDLIQRTWCMTPLSDPSSGTITCNDKGTTVPGAYHASVTAGGTIRSNWTSVDGYGWPHSTGPIVAYMAACGDDCNNITNTASLKWFKIAEEGLRDNYAVGDYEGWFQYDLWESQITDHWDIVVPKDLKPGRYMIRHEIIMLELDPIQFYPHCAALEVSGEGELVPSEEFLVQFPGEYVLLFFCFHSMMGLAMLIACQNYTVPGPKVWTGA